MVLEAIRNKINIQIYTFKIIIQVQVRKPSSTIILKVLPSLLLQTSLLSFFFLRIKVERQIKEEGDFSQIFPIDISWILSFYNSKSLFFRRLWNG